MYKIKTNNRILITTLILFCLFLTLASTSEAHVLIIGDSRSDLPDCYEHAVEANDELKDQGYETLLLTRTNATSSNVINGMKDADTIIYIGHGTTAGDKSTGSTNAPYGICTSDGTIWAIGNKLSLSSNGANSFTSPAKANATFIAVHTCYSFGRAGSTLYNNPYESTYYFSAPYVSNGGNYFATSYCKAFLQLIKNGGTRTFAEAWNQMHVSGTWTPKIVNGRTIYLTTGQSYGNYWDAYVGTGMSAVILPSANTVKAYTQPIKPASVTIKQADLYISKVTKTTYYYYVTVTNKGTATAGTNYLRVWYGKKAFNFKVNKLAAGKSQRIAVKISKFGSYSNVKYRKTMKADYYNAVKEKYETNNQYTTPAPKADLRIVSMTRKGKYYYIKVKNYGNAKANKNYLRIYYGSKGKNVAVKALNPGKYTTVKIRTSYLGKYANKKYTKTVKVDYYNKIIESNKANNIKKLKK